MKNFIFHQLFDSESSTFTYLIGDPVSKEALIIDPVLEKFERDLSLIRELNLSLKFILETHLHADHITGAGKLSEETGAVLAISKHAGLRVLHIPLEDRQTLKIGSLEITALYTPGHTDSCMCYHFSHLLFSGDTVLIRGNGRTDFQSGSPEKLFESIKNKLYLLPDETIVYPAHDYKGFTATTIGLEKKHNRRIAEGQTLEAFAQIMSELKLDEPKKINTAVPANLLGGRITSTKDSL